MCASLAFGTDPFPRLTQSYYSHNCSSNTQNHMCGNPNNNLPKDLCQYISCLYQFPYLSSQSFDYVVQGINSIPFCNRNYVTGVYLHSVPAKITSCCYLTHHFRQTQKTFKDWNTKHFFLWKQLRSTHFIFLCPRKQHEHIPESLERQIFSVVYEQKYLYHLWV